MSTLLDDVSSDWPHQQRPLTPLAPATHLKSQSRQNVPDWTRNTASWTFTAFLCLSLRVSTLFPVSHISVRDTTNVNSALQGSVVILDAEVSASVEGVGGTTAWQSWVEGTVLDQFRGTWLRRGARTILATTAFICLVVMALGGPANKHGVAAALGIRWAAALVFVVASLLLIRVGRLPKDRVGHSESIGPPVPTTPTMHEIWTARQQASLKYSPEVLDLFSRILSNSSQYLTRAVENVEVRDGCLCLRAIMEFAFNDEPTQKVRAKNDSVILLPLIKLSKNATLDNLDLTDSEDRHVAPLLQDEIYGLIAHVMDGLFRMAYINGSSAGAGRLLTQVEERVLGGLIHAVCNPGEVKDRAVADTLRLLDLVGGISKPLDKDAAESLRNLIEFFADNYLIAVEAELPRGSRLSMKYVRTVPLYEQAAKRADRSRVRLGLSPRSFSVPLTLPFEAPSYHFSMAGVPGSFAAQQTLFEVPTRNAIRQEHFQGQTQPYLNAKCESAAPYTHFHSRGLHRFTGINMWTRVEFEEVPPGALAGATVVSSACAILIWFFTLVQPGLPSSAVPTDLPALLLAVPAFAATWIGASADRVQRSSIATYIGLGVSTAISLASALLYIANSNHKSFFTIGSFTFDHGLIHLKHVDATWLVLAFVSSMMSAYLAETLRDNVRNYMKLLAHNADVGS